MTNDQRIPDLVSTIIPVFNRPEMLRQAVGSVLAQTYRPIEILVVDDGSTDETPKVAEALSAEYPGEVRFLRKENSGPGPTREAGRQLARGEFIQYLDSDDLLCPGKFAAQVTALHEHPECGVAYGRTRLTDMTGTVLADPFKWTGRLVPTLFPRLLVDRWWCTHTPLYRRSVCDAVGPWSDLRFSQDWEYDGRVGAMQVKLVWCDTPVSDHRQHFTQRQTGDGKWLSPADRVRFFELLLEQALQAGVERSGPEIHHFSRWVFFHARQCGALGDEQAARACYALARRARQHGDFGMNAYRWFAAVAGWRSAGRWSIWIRENLGKRPSPTTMERVG